MSTQPEPDYVDEQLSDQAVHDFLEDHPDFFERHPALLSRLRLPHATGGGAVSLVERQVSVLRQKDVKLERQLKELLSVARENDLLAAKIHELSLHLLGASTLDATVHALEEAMRAAFSADHAVLVLFADPESVADIDAGRFFRAIQRDDPALKPFSTFLDANSPRCGTARDSQLDFLFHGDAADVGSVALLPLGEQCRVGFMGVGSVDADRFHPGLSLDFLSRVGDLVAASLSRF